MSDDALDMVDEKDSNFDLDSVMKQEYWTTHLDRDDRVSLSLFLYFKLGYLAWES